ncbi:MAG: ABC transporter permease, partial [Candidatus Acidiferrales bacterium]
MRTEALISRFRTIASRIRGFFFSRRLDDDFQEELASHLSMLEEESLRRGLPPDEARRQARLRLGAEAPLRETHHDLRSIPWLESLLQDIRFGLRMLRKSPGFTAVAILTLAIGAATAMFTLVNAILYRELPVAHPEQLVQLRTVFHTGRSAPFSLPMFQEIEGNQEVFSGIFAWSGGGPANVEVHGQLARDNVYYVSGGFYSQLGEYPLLGRLIEPVDANPSGPVSRVVVISYGYWQSQFARNPAVLGKQILLENHPFTIIGVTQKEFVGLDTGTTQDITAPITALSVSFERLGVQITSRHLLWLNIIGRLKPGVSVSQARAQLTGIWPAILAEAIPPDEKGARRQQFLSMRLAVSSAARGPNWDQRAQSWQPLRYLMGMVMLILLAVCVNLASLMLARGAGRMHETSIRLALGATPWRIAVQTLVEGLLLSSGGALLGLVFAYWGARWIFA